MHDVRDMEKFAAAADVKDKAERVARFNAQIVGFPVPDSPQLLSEDRQAFRQQFIREENDEIEAAYRAGDLEGVVDGHIDAVYVHLGALNEMGVASGAAFDVVHEANMAKKRGELSKRASSGYDAVKPPGWKAPSHADLLTITNEDVETILALRSGKAKLYHPSDSMYKTLMADAVSRQKGENIDGSPRRETVVLEGVGYTRQVKANDDFEFVGSNIPKSVALVHPEHKLIGKDGFVLSVDEAKQQADVRFYEQGLPQLMTVSLREIKYKPKKLGSFYKGAVGAGSDELVPVNPELKDLDFTPIEKRLTDFFVLRQHGGPIEPWLKVENGMVYLNEAAFPTVESKPRVMVMGYARHGKDTVADLLQSKYGLRFTSSSAFCAERVVLPAVKALWQEWTDGRPVPMPAIPNYETAQECFEDRHNHRTFWYQLITNFNTPDLTSLGRAIFEQHDVYCGIRNAREFHSLRNASVFDVAIWVDAYERIGSKEDESSCTVEPWMADFVLDNNGSLVDLERNLDVLMTSLQGAI